MQHSYATPSQCQIAREASPCWLPVLLTSTERSPATHSQECWRGAGLGVGHSVHLPCKPAAQPRQGPRGVWLHPAEPLPCPHLWLLSSGTPVGAGAVGAVTFAQAGLSFTSARERSTGYLPRALVPADSRPQDLCLPRTLLTAPRASPLRVRHTPQGQVQNEA